MEALMVQKLGDPTVPPWSPSSPLTLTTSHPIPDLSSPTSVRVRVRAASLNFLSYLQAMGKYQDKPPLPFIPSADYSGVVHAVGPAVTAFRVGDRVCGGGGGFAQFVVAEESRLTRVPDSCDLVAAAALPVAYGTSHVALVHRARLLPNQVLLVLGAAGGVGLSAVQIGKIIGATVIAVARGDEKVQFLKSLGNVDHIIDSSNTNVIESVKNFLKSRNLKGVDVLYDPVGGKLGKDSLKLLNWGAQILIIGFASDEVPVIPLNIALVKNWTIHGLYLARHDLEVRQDGLKELLSWLSMGLLKVNISHQFSLAEAHLAFAALKDRRVIGKVMITIDNRKVFKSRL